MIEKNWSYCTAVLLLLTVVFLCGCGDVNRKYFTRFEPLETEAGEQHFTYTAFTRSPALLLCRPGSSCSSSNYQRAVLWPADDEEAEAVRMRWLKEWVLEICHEGAEYEIVVREPVVVDSNLIPGGVYSVNYEVALKVADELGDAKKFAATADKSDDLFAQSK